MCDTNVGEAEKVRAELANCNEFAALSEQSVEVNAAICAARRITLSARSPRPGREVKMGLAAHLRSAFAAEAGDLSCMTVNRPSH